MPATITVTILADNTVGTRGLLAEHGLAYWIEVGPRRLLFDTGQGLVLTANARALGLDLRAVDTLVLSHGHYDHTGGLAAVLDQASGHVTVHAHPDALLPRFHCEPAGSRPIGIPLLSLASLAGPRCHVQLSRDSSEVAPGVWATGEVPRRHREEPILEPFCLDPEGHRPDPLPDDQALFVDTDDGTVVLLGCAHAGVINTLEHIQRLTRSRPLHTVIGGLHLGRADDARLAWTVGALRRLGVQRLVPTHCTGAKATARLWTAFPERCAPGGVGTVLAFPCTGRRQQETR